MNDTATSNLNEFVTTYREVTFPNSEELFRAIEQDLFFNVLRTTGGQPCREIAQVYRQRALMVAPGSPYADEDLRKEFSLIADILETSPEEPSRAWMFRGRTACFSVFEMEQSKRIAGCLKRDGASNIEITRNEEA